MKPLTLVAFISAFVLSANAADTFKVDPVHSFVLFSVQHLGIANTYGRFNDISGIVVFDKDNPSKSSVELSVQVESLDTHNSIRDRSVKSPDFFSKKVAKARACLAKCAAGAKRASRSGEATSR